MYGLRQRSLEGFTSDSWHIRLRVKKTRQDRNLKLQVLIQSEPIML